MTPRVDAWMRQANSDWAVAELTAEQGFHSQACYHYGQATEKALSEQARSVAEHVLAFARTTIAKA